jgi:hypothetical protein
MPCTNMSTPSVQQLQRAIEIAEQIEQLEQELRNVLNGGEATVVEVAPAIAPLKSSNIKGRKKSVRSPEVRARMAAAQRARWAKARK